MICVHNHVYNIRYIYSGVPVAWAIMDKEDTASHRAFFSAIKDRVPTAEVTCVMTDDGKTPVLFACLQ